MSATLFEKNIAEQEKKRKLLSYLSEGTTVPYFLIESEFKKENECTANETTTTLLKSGIEFKITEN